MSQVGQSSQPSSGFLHIPQGLLTCTAHRGVFLSTQKMWDLQREPRGDLSSALRVCSPQAQLCFTALQIIHSQGCSHLPMDLILEQPHQAKQWPQGAASSSHLHPSAPTPRQSWPRALEQLPLTS